jgi:hypothetical protein
VPAREIRGLERKCAKLERTIEASKAVTTSRRSAPPYTADLPVHHRARPGVSPLAPICRALSMLGVPIAPRMTSRARANGEGSIFPTAMDSLPTSGSPNPTDSGNASTSTARLSRECMTNG